MKFKENGEPTLRKRDINRINIEEGKKFTTPFLININCQFDYIIDDSFIIN